MGLFSDRRLRIAVEASVLLHLLLAWLGPQGHAVLAALMPAPEPMIPATQPQPDEPIRFELVELPDQREETPSRPDAPASDLSRRAHGGEGAPDRRPSARGTSFEARLTPPSQAPVQQPAAPAAPPAPDRRAQPREPVPDLGEAGRVAVLEPQPEPVPDTPVLKGLAPATGVPALGAAPDRSGGQVDLGPLAFDTQWYDWGPYAAEMLRRIRYHWQIPEIARLGVQGVCKIRFLIERSGRVTGLEVQADAAHPPMTFAARDAILNASPLPPLPPDLVGVEREGVTITFYYNTRPPEEGERR